MKAVKKEVQQSKIQNVMSKTAGNNMFDWFRRHFIASPET